MIDFYLKANNSLEDIGYQHMTVNHSMNFKDPETGAYINTIDSIRHHVKASMPNYN